MIPQPTVHRIFEYRFRPMADSQRLDPASDGFRLFLTNDGLLTLVHIFRNNQSTRQQFRVNPQLINDYFQLLGANNRLFSLPTCLTLPQNLSVTCCSMLFLDKLDPFDLRDFGQLITLRDPESYGRAARILMVFFDDLTELFRYYGVHLDVNTVSIDYGVLTPLTDNTMNPDWMNTVS